MWIRSILTYILCLGSTLGYCQQLYIDNRDSSVTRYFSNIPIDHQTLANSPEGLMIIPFTVNTHGEVLSIKEPFKDASRIFPSLFARLKLSSGKWVLPAGVTEQNLLLPVLSKPFYADSIKVSKQESTTEFKRLVDSLVKKYGAVQVPGNSISLPQVRIVFELKKYTTPPNRISYLANSMRPDIRLISAVKILQDKGIDSIFVYNSFCGGCEVIPKGENCNGLAGARITWKEKGKTYSKRVYCDNTKSKAVKTSSGALNFILNNIGLLTARHPLPNGQSYPLSPIHYSGETFYLVVKNRWLSTNLLLSQKDNELWSKYSWINAAIRLSDLYQADIKRLSKL